MSRYTRALGCALWLGLAPTACTREPAASTGRSGSLTPMRHAEGALQRPTAEVTPRAQRPGPAPARVNLAPQPAALSDKLALPSTGRLVALGDLHGDLAAARRALVLVGAVEARGSASDQNSAASDHWSGGALTLVQTGDVLDRGDDDRAILDLLLKLQEEAPSAGGRVLLLSGNHELMNVQQNFSYVTSGGFAAYGGQGARATAFLPGGSYARKLAQLPIVLKVGDTVFVHGGVLPDHVSYGLDRMNEEVQRWMRGERFDLPNIVNAADGLLWTRVYSFETDDTGCDQLVETLRLLSAKRMVVGHTPQLQGVTSGCDEKVWRIDVGMSRYYGGPVQGLQIQDGSVTVLRE